ncbi:hypothetical protein FSP39_000166 [Pinctada imbricata]|uniref:Receptor-binding cancer antigen expressed on SiSo cells n=1 Tax=Pinctada imbricata TaxID=66713 RepID=A0AA89BMM0_PINIB|nr:hypothetical protein FSP39_000166 [Pinctada imbricata]
MIKVIWNIIKKIFGVIFLVLSPLKRLCCRRKRRNSDTILPLTNNYSIPSDFKDSPTPSFQGELQSWDSWDGEEKTNHHGNSQTGPHSMQRSRSKQDSVSEEPEIDFFSDMTPQIKRQRKLYIGNNEDRHSNSSNKFAVYTDIPLNQGSELETWEEGENAWEGESMEDLSWEAEAAIKQSRKHEQQRRLQEHQRRKLEKENLRSKKEGQLSAVKLS